MPTNKQAYAKQAVEDKTRWYEHWMCESIPEGVKYPSVTSILGVIDKPFLRVWYGQNGTTKAEQYKQCISEQMVKYLTPKFVDAILSQTEQSLGGEFWMSGHNLSDKAKDIGTMAHDTIENWAKTGRWVVPNEVRPLIVSFTDEFIHKNKVEVIASEISVVSNVYKYAGRLDMVAKINGKLAIVDIKTSSGFYPEMGLQLSAYKQAYYEMSGIMPEELWIIRLDKKTKKVQLKKYDDSLEIFLAAQSLWQGLNPPKKEVINVTDNLPKQKKSDSRRTKK